MSEQLKYIKTQSEKLKVDCEFVNYHFENTSTTISDSITNLAELVAKKSEERVEIAVDVDKLKEELEKHQNEIDAALTQNQKAINDELAIIDKRLREAIEKARKEMSGSCCVIV